MAGHSHWSNIKRKKAVNDAKKNKHFTKLAKAITVTAREDGGDPQFNPTLADAIDKAKSYNLPKSNIERAIKRGSGELEGVIYEEIICEGYGPDGVAYMVTAITDNKNRTIAEIRSIFGRFGGSIGAPGSTSFIFGKDPTNPQFVVEITEKVKAKKILELTDILDDHDDVQKVFTNFDIPEDLVT